MTDNEDKSNNAEGNKEEEPDEWTALAKTYTAALVPAFAPIYQAMAEHIIVPSAGRVLDFGCGPGEPILTMACQNPKLIAVGVDSTPSMLEIAKERVNNKDKEEKIAARVSFVHVRRDVSMTDFKTAVSGGGEPFDAVVSSFVFHYLEFDRRVEVMKALLELAPTVLLVTWGTQNKVPFLKAIKTFGKWKSSSASSSQNNIVEIQIDDEDNDQPESPRGSFTMARHETFQAIADKLPECELTSCETKSISLSFPNVKALLSFLPFPTITEEDCTAMKKLLHHWKDEKQQGEESSSSVSILDNGELRFDTNVVFAKLERRTAKKRKQDNTETKG